MTTTLTRMQAMQLASNAGFTGQAIDIIVAIAQAESGLRDTPPDNINTDGSHDRGILQINNRWHPEVDNACAYSPACAFKQGYKISNNGTNFNPWSTYTSGAYKSFLTGNSVIVTPNPFNLQPANPFTKTYDTISNTTTEVLNSVPGFKGIVEALDIVEQFQPLKLQSGTTPNTEGPTDYTIFGVDTGIPNVGAIANKVQKSVTLPANNIQAVLVFIAANTAAFVIRGLLIFIGLVIIIALVQNIIGKNMSEDNGMLNQLLGSVL